jgi:hypothetical protein
MAIIKGTDQPQLNKRAYSFDKRTGWTSTQIIEGERDNILRLAGRYSFIADTLDISTDGPTATMTARFGKDDTSPETPGTGVIPTTWELMGQSVQRDVSDNPKANSIKDFRDIAHIKKLAKDILDPSKTVTITNALATTLPSTASWSPVHKVLLYKYAFRQENTLTTEWVLRKNQVVTSNYELELATAGVDQIWTSTKLFKGETNVPVALMKSVSATTKPTAALFATAGDLLETTGYDYVYGWLKQAPQMTYTTGGQVERSQEWYLNYWFTFDYPLY